MRGSVAAETLVRWKRVERETMGSRFHRLQSSIEERREGRGGTRFFFPSPRAPPFFLLIFALEESTEESRIREKKKKKKEKIRITVSSARALNTSKTNTFVKQNRRANRIRFTLFFLLSYSRSRTLFERATFRNFEGKNTFECVNLFTHASFSLLHRI